MKPVLAYANMQIFMDAILADPALFDAGGTQVILHLYKNDLTPNIATVIGDFEEATFTGYAEKGGRTYLSGITPDGRPCLTDSAVPFWSCTAEPAEPQTIYGIYMENTEEETLVMSMRFDEPVEIHNGTTFAADLPLVVANDPAEDRDNLMQ